MSMKDHYPAKKRRLTLSSKTPTRVTPNGSRAHYSQIESPKVSEITLPKKKHRSSPASTGGNRSTDESTVEIHWDNNSSQIQTKPKRGRGRKKKDTNLSSLIKQIPKTRKSLESCSTEDANFSTWMQQNLAPVCTRKQNYSLRQNSSRLSLARGAKIEALDFSEKIKKFLQEEEVPVPQPSAQRESPISSCSSPCLLPTQSPKTQSPSYFSSGSADSLLNFDNLEDSLLAGIDSTAAPSKTPIRNSRNVPTRRTTPMRSCRSRSSTPVLSRSARKQTTRPIPNLYTVDEQKDSGISTGSKNQLTDKCSNVEAEVIKKDSNNNNNCSKKDKQQSQLIGIDFDDNDEIDQILSTQPDILPREPINTNLSKAFKKVKTEQNDIPPNNKSKLKLKKQTTSLQTKKVTTISTTPDLLDNDVDGFDELLATFDMDSAEIKCKSQEITPVRRLTESQRKLNTKCHTSPLPLNSHQRKILDQSTAFVPISKPSGSSSTNKLDTDMQTLSIRSPVVCKKTNFNTTAKKVESQNGSFVRKNMVTTACRKPFVPPKASGFCSTITSSMTLELSAIEGRMPGVDLVETCTTIPPGLSSKTFECFSSTQKCTMEEIEQKRKFAQMKLRERLGRKRK